MISYDMTIMSFSGEINRKDFNLRAQSVQCVLLAQLIRNSMHQAKMLALYQNLQRQGYAIL